MSFDPFSPTRQAHVKRIYAADPSGNVQQDVWIDVLRIDHLFTHANPALSENLERQGQEYYLNFEWQDDQGAADSDNTSRTTEQISITMPDGTNSANLNIIDKMTLTDYGSETQGQEWQWAYLNQQGDGTQTTDRTATVVAVTYNDLGGDDGGANFDTMNWDDYQKLMNAGTNPNPDKTLNVEIPKEIRFTSQTTPGGFLGMELDVALLNDDVIQLFSAPSQGGTSSGIVRLDPLQTIVNFKATGGKVGLLKIEGGDPVRWSQNGYDPFNPGAEWDGYPFPTKPVPPAGDIGQGGNVADFSFVPTSGPPNPPTTVVPLQTYWSDNVNFNFSPPTPYLTAAGISNISSEGYDEAVANAYSDPQQQGYPVGGGPATYTVRQIDSGLRYCATWSSGFLVGLAFLGLNVGYLHLPPFPAPQQTPVRVSFSGRLIYGQYESGIGPLNADAGPPLTFYSYVGLFFGQGGASKGVKNDDTTWFGILGTSSFNPDDVISELPWISVEEGATFAKAQQGSCGYSPGPVSDVNRPLMNWPLTPPSPPNQPGVLYALSSTDLAVTTTVRMPPPIGTSNDTTWTLQVFDGGTYFHTDEDGVTTAWTSQAMKTPAKVLLTDSITLGDAPFGSNIYGGAITSDGFK